MLFIDYWNRLWYTIGINYGVWKTSWSSNKTYIHNCSSQWFMETIKDTSVSAGLKALVKKYFKGTGANQSSGSSAFMFGHI